MCSPSRHFVSLLVDDPPEVAAFYVDLFGLTREFVSDWFIHLRGAGGIELGLLRRPTDLLPTQPPGGTPNVLLTFVVDDVDAWVARARKRGAQVLQDPTDRPYGQRVALLRDPAGTWVDVSSPCDPDPSWLARLEQTQDGWRER